MYKQCDYIRYKTVSTVSNWCDAHQDCEWQAIWMADTKNEFVVLNELPFREREISDELHTEVAWNLAGGTRGIGSVRWKMPVILGNWSRHVRSKDSAWLLGLISVDQPREKFMCRPRYIRHVHRAARTRARAASRKKHAVIQDTTVSCPVAIPPMRSETFLPRVRATARRQYP